MIKYDKNNNPKYVISSPIKHTKKWRQETMKEFYNKYGHWYYFAGVPMRKKKQWIEQFRRKGV